MDTLSHGLWGYLVRKKDRYLIWFIAGNIFPDLIFLVTGAVLLATGTRLSDIQSGVLTSPMVKGISYYVHSYLIWAAFAALVHAVRPLMVFAWGWLLHLVIDTFTHAKDAHPVIWPVADWRIHSPLSYYDPPFAGRLFSIVNATILFILLYVRWRQSLRPPIRKRY